MHNFFFHLFLNYYLARAFNKNVTMKFSIIFNVKDNLSIVAITYNVSCPLTYLSISGILLHDLPRGFEL